MLDSFFNWIFAPIMKLGKFWALVIISFILTALITFIYKWTTNQQLLKQMREEIKQHQSKMKDHKDNPQKVMELKKRSMEVNLQYMKHSMKPMLITFIPLIIIFGWLRKTFDTGAVITFPFKIPLIGNDMGWLGVYIISSIIFSTLLRKVLKIH